MGTAKGKKKTIPAVTGTEEPPVDERQTAGRREVIARPDGPERQGSKKKPITRTRGDSEVEIFSGGTSVDKGEISSMLAQEEFTVKNEHEVEVAFEKLREGDHSKRIKEAVMRGLRAISSKRGGEIREDAAEAARLLKPRADTDALGKVIATKNTSGRASA